MVTRFESLAQRKESFFNQEDLNEIVRTTLELLRPEIMAKNLTLITDYHPQPLVGRLNPHLLKVALSHLIRNAVEASRPQGKIMVRTMVDKDYAVLTIQDTGRGMPPEVVEKVFVPAGAVPRDAANTNAPATPAASRIPSRQKEVIGRLPERARDRGPTR